MSTTKNNPGSYVKFKPVTIRKIISKSKGWIKDNDYKGLWNGLRSEIDNLINQNRRTDHFYCNLCENSSIFFVNISNRLRIKWHSACPQCNSRKRHRGLKVLYENILKDAGEITVLHFAPEPVYYPVFDKFNIVYKTTDRFLEDVDFPGEDIQSLSFEDNQFDLILCNHVIEHVEDDEKSFRELARISKTNGKIIITLPGDWRRKHTIYFDDLSFNGHYRDYGKDVLEKLEKVFSKINVIDLFKFNNQYDLPLGLSPNSDWAFICEK